MAIKMESMSKANLLCDKRVLGKHWKKTYKGYFGSRKNMQIFVAQLLPYTPKNKELRILYPGSGSGFLGEELAKELEKRKAKAHLWLIDFSKEHLGQNSNPKTKKILGDILKVKLAKKFDLIIMRSTLDYFWNEKSQIRVLKKLKKWLAPDGIFFNQAASMPSTIQRNLADRIYRSNKRIGQRHFQCSSDIAKIYRKGSFDKLKKIGDAPAMVITEKEHCERYGISKKQISKIQKIIEKIPAKKRPNIKITKTGYSMKFVFPIYLATAKG